MSYLRSVLTNNFRDHDDYSYLMVSSPRVIKFEILVIDFAIQILEEIGKTILFKDGVSLDEDRAKLAQTSRIDEFNVLLRNI